MHEQVGRVFVEEFMMMVSFVAAFLGFVLGSIAVLAVEALLILYAIRRLSKDNEPAKNGSFSPPQKTFDHSQSLPSAYQKQGVLWILEPEKVPKISASVEQTRKSEIFKVSPVRKLARIQDHTLILTEGDGSLSKIMLKGCEVVAVSATSVPSRKWAKRYPIKLASQTAALYHHSRILYVYAETSLEKESWCRALRLASFDDAERVLWFSKLNEEFQSYLKCLTEGYPSLTKPSMGYLGGSLDKVNRPDDSRSKVRQLWKKISKKKPPSSNDEKRIPDRFRAGQGPVSASSFKKTAIPGKISNACVDDISSVCSSVSNLSRNSGYASDNSDADTADRFDTDESTLCWNMIVSRLFFDAKNNADIKSSLKARIQRSLSNMRTPSYMGEINCTDLDLGSLPPYIHTMRAVPADADDLGALEMDVEYCGGLVLYIEARLEVGELDLPNGTSEPSTESSSGGEEMTDLLEDFRHLEGEFKLSDGVGSKEQNCTGDSKLGKNKNSKTGISTASSGSRWKSMLNSVAKHVSQVPLSLAIRVVALRGTLQLNIKPPPTDQLWFGFTAVPDLNFELESTVGDHKITNGRVASFFVNRLKVAIREALVLPNCENVCVPWMLAEKDDWVPRSTAPFISLCLPLSTPIPLAEVSNSHSCEEQTGDKDQESKPVEEKKVDSVKPPIPECARRPPRSSGINRSVSDGSALQYDLSTPLLQDEGEQGCNIHRENAERRSFSKYVSYREHRNNSEDGEAKPKKMGRRAKMLDLGKKMGEKFEEKKRHIVEKMRGP